MGLESWGSYPSSHALGHKAVADIFEESVTVEEKIDGSQFSFAYFPGEGGLRFKTRKAEVYVSADGHASEKMFQKAVDSVRARMTLLTPGWTYRAEYLPKTKAVTLAYDRVPKDYLIGFDVSTGDQHFLPYFDKVNEFTRLGFETVPIMYEGWVTDIEVLKRLLDTTSILGGQKIEGIVVKNYARFGLDKKILLGKYVSEAFKEIHGKNWKETNPQSGDIVQTIIGKLRTPARWNKAVQHLLEAGKLEGSPRDIGSLFQEVPADVRGDSEEEIKELLFKWAWPQISRGITAGMAQWYKDRLLESQRVADVDVSMERSMTGVSGE